MALSNPSASELIAADQTTRYIAAAFMGIAAFVGFIWTTYIVIWAVTSLNDMSTFNAISSFRSAANFFALCGYLYWQLPCTFLYHFLKFSMMINSSGRRAIDIRVNHFITTTMANMYGISQFMGICQCVDRIFLFVLPSFYTRFISPIIVAVVFAIIVSWRVFVVTQIYQDGCMLIYDETYLLWTMYPEQKCANYFYPGDAFVYQATWLLVFSIYPAALLIIVVQRCRSRGSVSQKIRGSDIKLYFQALCQQVLFLCDFTCIAIIGPNVTYSPLLTFLTQAYMGELVHVFDGLFFLLFQWQKLSEPLKKFFSKKEHDSHLVFQRRY